MAQKYDVVVTNPPYMGSSGMGARLAEFVKKQYPDSKSDLFAVFMERGREYAKANGYLAMITQHAWMFLSSFEKLRAKLMEIDTVNMAHLGARAFEEIGGEVVQTTAFVMQNRHVHGFKGMYARLIEPTTQDGKEEMFLDGQNRFSARQDNFEKIPGAPVAYWVSEKLVSSFMTKKVSDYGNAIEGIKTGDNEHFLRFWFEVSNGAVSLLSETLKGAIKWIFTTKGGEYRKWYGNIDYVMYWERDGEEILSFSRSTFYQRKYFFKPAVTWTYLTSGNISFRFLGKGLFYNNKGPAVFCDTEEDALLLTAFLNTCVASSFQNLLNPTLTILPGNIRNIPCILAGDNQKHIKSKAEINVQMSKADWDSFETSWDFKRHPLI